jgi:Holliday junction DNA helicase RuvA
MIASLTGRLRRKAADYLILDVAGVGYRVFAPLSTYAGLPEGGDEINLHIHTHVREDSLSLFGFLTEAEKDMFLLLMSVSGIGPKLALAVLSNLSVRDLSQAIQASEDSKLCGIPGIGKKTAARMVLELKDKMSSLAASVSREPGTHETGNAEDALSALMNLGYKKPLAEEALKKAQNNRSGLSLAELIREALNVLMRR